MSDFIVDKLTKSVGDKTVFREISFIFTTWIGSD